MIEHKQGPIPDARRGGLQDTGGLGDLELEVDGERLELSLPDEGPARMRLQGTMAFGFAAPDGERVRQFLHRRGLLRNENGVTLGEVVLREVSPELDVVNGDFIALENAVAPAP